MDDSTFKFLKNWSYNVAGDICFDNEDILHWLNASTYRKKISSIILESMSPSKEWKKR